MTERLDALLNRLKSAPLDHDLARLEASVLNRIGRQSRGDVFGGRTLQVQFAVTCGALLLGLAVAELAGSGLLPRPLNSHLIALSHDIAIAPPLPLQRGI